MVKKVPGSVALWLIAWPVDGGRPDRLVGQ